MPEDQGVNGNIWNNEAASLLKQLHWVQIGDYNIDIKGEDGKDYGIDCLLKFYDTRRKETFQGVFLEAKHYKTTSFKKSLLEEWIKKLDNKLNKIKNSVELHERYHEINGSVLRNGVIAIWFSDYENYISFRSGFKNMLSEIKVPSSYQKSSNKIYILHNENLLKLVSIVDTVKNYNLLNRGELFFYYTQSERYNTPADRQKTLTLDYMYSKFILADSIDNNGQEYKVVFYFGDLNIQSFKRLKSALSQFNYHIKQKPLTIYTYQTDDQFRKIKSDVEKLFSEITFDLKEMQLFMKLPQYI